MGRHRWLIQQMVVGLLLLSLAGVVTGKSRYSVEQLTAAFVYNISNFVKWPKNGTEQINICILGREQQKIGQILRKIIAKKSKSKRIHVSEFNDLIALESFQTSVTRCHMLFFEAEIFSLRQASFDQDSTLLIGRSIDFLQHGGMLSLILENNKMSIYVNHNAVNQSRIRLSSRLLLIAKAVE